MPINISGKTLVFTGTLARMTRMEATIHAIGRGARVSNTVTSWTDYVVAGTGAGSKLSKAKNLLIKVMSENDWYQIIDGGGPIPNPIKSYTIPSRGPKKELKKIPDQRGTVGFPELDLD